MNETSKSVRPRQIRVPNTPLTFRALRDACIPPPQVALMLGKTFFIQYANPGAEEVFAGSLFAPDYYAGASVEIGPEHGVLRWTVPWDVVELIF